MIDLDAAARARRGTRERAVHRRADADRVEARVARQERRISSTISCSKPMSPSVTRTTCALRRRARDAAGAPRGCPSRISVPPLARRSREPARGLALRVGRGRRRSPAASGAASSRTRSSRAGRRRRASRSARATTRLACSSGCAAHRAARVEEQRQIARRHGAAIASRRGGTIVKSACASVESPVARAARVDR